MLVCWFDFVNSDQIVCSIQDISSIRNELKSPAILVLGKRKYQIALCINENEKTATVSTRHRKYLTAICIN